MQMTTRKTVLTIAAVASPLFLFLWEQVQATRLGYEVNLTQTELRHARERVAYLRLELDRLDAPESVASAARRRLGMAAPTPESIVVLGAARLAPAPAVAAAPKAPAMDAPRLLSRLPAPE